MNGLTDALVKTSNSVSSSGNCLRSKFVEVVSGIAGAFRLALVDPYERTIHPVTFAPDREVEENRDPSW